MKKTLLAATLVLAGSAHAIADNNKVLKMCLAANGYTPDQFDTFDFGPAANCFHEWKIADTEQDYVKMRAFLEEHPWYRGKNWRWEEYVEYTCSTVISTKHTRNPTVCSKPIRIN
jgi:hypothetical protein